MAPSDRTQDLDEAGEAERRTFAADSLWQPPGMAPAWPEPGGSFQVQHGAPVGCVMKSRWFAKMGTCGLEVAECLAACVHGLRGCAGPACHPTASLEKSFTCILPLSHAPSGQRGNFGVFSPVSALVGAAPPGVASDPGLCARLTKALFCVDSCRSGVPFTDFQAMQVQPVSASRSGQAKPGEAAAARRSVFMRPAAVRPLSTVGNLLFYNQKKPTKRFHKFYLRKGDLSWTFLKCTLIRSCWLAHGLS